MRSSSIDGRLGLDATVEQFRAFTEAHWARGFQLVREELERCGGNELKLIQRLAEWLPENGAAIDVPFAAPTGVAGEIRLKVGSAIINEDDLCAIVTRRLFAEYPHFKGGSEIAVTEKIELVSKDGKDYFTSLLTVFIVCQKLKRLFQRPRGSAETAPENIIAFQKIVAEFFDFVIAHEPALHRYFVDNKTTPAKERKGNRNLVFRPIGLELLARLYVYFLSRDKLEVFQWALENLDWKNPGGVLDGTVWVNERIQPKGKKLAVDYVLYLLKELPTREHVRLRDELRDFRKDPSYELPAQVRVTGV